MTEKESLDFLIFLRDAFREDFKNNDYCVGQEHVERMFRQLLNEPEPELISNVKQSYTEASKIFQAELEKFGVKAKHIMESDDSFFRKFK